MDRARRTRLKRSGLLAALCLHAVAGTAALPEAARFAADIDSGKVDLETFDFAAAGFWDAPPEQRWPWFASIQSAVNLDPGAHAGCEVESRRRYAAAAWFIPVPTSQNAAEWKATVSALRRRIAAVDAALDGVQRKPPVTNALHVELMRRFELDQKVRQLPMEPPPADFPAGAALAWGAVYGIRWSAVDCDNTRWLKEQLQSIGWFDIPTHGAEADEAAWHLVQHADREPDFQRRMLSFLQGLPPGHTSPKRIAYLWDRVAGQDGRLQRYGTQGVCQPDGSWRANPVEDPAHVDERRIALGLKPLAEHAAAIAREYCPRP